MDHKEGSLDSAEFPQHARRHHRPGGSRDIIGRLRELDFITSGPRSPQPAAPYTYVTPKRFLEQFSLDTLRDFSDIEALEDAGLFDRASRSKDGMPVAGSDDDDGSDEPDESD